MIWPTLKAVRATTECEFTPALAAKHCYVKCLNGGWTRTLGPPGKHPFDDSIRTVHVRGNIYKTERIG